MKDAVIVSTVRSRIGVAFKGTLNNTSLPTLERIDGSAAGLFEVA